MLASNPYPAITNFSLSLSSRTSSSPSWRLIPIANFSSNSFNKNISISYCGEASCGTNYVLPGYISVQFSKVNDAMAAAALSLPSFLPAAHSDFTFVSNRGNNGKKQDKSKYEIIATNYLLYNNASNSALVASGFSSASQASHAFSPQISASNSPSDLNYGSIVLPVISQPIFSVPVDLAKLITGGRSRYGGGLSSQVMPELVWTFSINQDGYRITSAASNQNQNTGSQTFSRQFSTALPPPSNVIQFANVSSTSSVTPSQSMEAIFSVTMNSVEWKDNNVWNVTLLNNGTQPRAVTIQPNGITDWYLGICSQCLWSYNQSTNATVVAVFHTTSDDPRVQFTLISS